MPHPASEPPENSCRPAADVLFRSAAELYQSKVLAVVMTGMGKDGLEGVREIRRHGGQVVTQDQATSSVWGMPGAVAQAGLAHFVLPLAQIGRKILAVARVTPLAANSAPGGGRVVGGRR